MLRDIIPAAARRWVYAAYAVAVVVVGALNVADIDTGKAADVLAYLGAAIGFVAAANVTTSDDAPAEPGLGEARWRDERGVSDLGLILAVILIALFAFIFYGRH